MRGLWQLVALELKIFLREPMGVMGTIGMPVILFVVLGRMLKGKMGVSEQAARFVTVSLPILATIMVALSAVTSLIAILAIYREGGILKRLRATPLTPLTILSTHVIVKLLLSAVTLVLLGLLGRSVIGPVAPARPVLFVAAMALAFVSILSVGFVVASLVPTARFAQPLGSVILYPLLTLSGLFFPLSILPTGWRVVAWCSPLTHAVALLQGLWTGVGGSDLLLYAAALVANLLLCSAIASRVFRWE